MTDDFFATHPVFTRAQFEASRAHNGQPSPRTVDSLLRHHETNGRIVRVRRGLYAAVPRASSAGTLQVDPYLIATHVADDATVAYHAALQFHGRTYSIWNRVKFLSRRRVRAFAFNGTRYEPVRPRHTVANRPDMGGCIELRPHANGEVRVTTLERALVDVLDQAQLGGGWEEIWRSLEMIEFVDLDAVLDYTRALDTALTTARVGFFLEQHRDAWFIDDAFLDTLATHAPRQPTYLESAREPGRLQPRWNLIVPEWILERRWAEVT